MTHLIKSTEDRNLLADVHLEPLSALPAPSPYSLKRYREDRGDCWVVLDRNGDAVAYYEWWENYDATSEQIESNLKLLTAAPDLLDALTYLSGECARLPWSLLTGEFFRALRLSGTIRGRLFVQSRESTYMPFRREPKRSFLAKGK